MIPCESIPLIVGGDNVKTHNTMTYDLQTLLLIEVDTIAVLASLVCGVLIWRSRREVPDHSRIILVLIVLTALPLIGKVISLMKHGLDNRFIEVLPIIPTIMGLLTVVLMLLYAVEVMRPNWLNWRHILALLSSFTFILVLSVLFIIYYTWYELHERILPPPISEEQETSEAPIPATSSDDLWLRIVKIIHKDDYWRNPDLSLDMLCQLLGSNKDYVSRCFRQNADTTFLDYVNNLRISYVTDELRRNPLQNLRALFFNAGFRSKTTAYRNFCKYVGQSPTEFAASLSRDKK